MFVVVSVINMRKTASQDSEVVSQALFAEKVTVIQKSGKWSLIKTSDGYTGWVLTNTLKKIPETYDTTVKVCRVMAHIYAEKDIALAPVLTLPYGVSLKVVDESDPDWIQVQLPHGLLCFVRKGTVAPLKILSKQDIVEFSKRFLDVPYVWGGRSSLGFDCSGFVQMLYGEMGIRLERDSGLQFKDPRFESIEQDQLKEGDLIFWGLSSEKIRHVALYIGDGQFIHASVKEHMPWIRISNLTDPAWNGGPDGAYPYRVFSRLIT